MFEAGHRKNQLFGAVQETKSKVVPEIELPAFPILFGIESQYQIYDPIRMTFLESILSLTKGRSSHAPGTQKGQEASPALAGSGPQVDARVEMPLF